MRYSGRVYDGPWEGRQLAHDHPWYEFHWSPETLLAPVWTGPPSTMVYAYRLQYRWSNPLRAWVFDWRSAPQPNSQKPMRSPSQPKLRKMTGDWLA